MPANVENSAVATGLKKVSFHSNPKERQCQKCSNCHTLSLILHPRKVTFKILQPRFQQYVYRELPNVQASFRKGRGTRDQIANIRWITEKAREFQKNIYFCFIDYAKAFDCVRKIYRRRGRLPTPVFLGIPCGTAGKNLPAMWETWVQSLG